MMQYASSANDIFAAWTAYSRHKDESELARAWAAELYEVILTLAPKKASLLKVDKMLEGIELIVDSIEPVFGLGDEEVPKIDNPFKS